METENGSRRPWRQIVDPAVLSLLLLVAWEKGVEIYQIKPYLLPPPSRVLDVLWENRIVLLEETWTTSYEILLGYFLAVAGGVVLGLAIFLSPAIRRTFYPLVVLFQGLPKVALAPLLVIWFGYGLASKVVMAFMIAFFPILVSTLGGLAGTPANLLEHFRAIRAAPATTFVRLQLPAALPSIMDGCKTAMPLAVIGAIVGEFVSSNNGLGHLILEATASARTDLVFAVVVVISAITGVMYWFVELAAARVWWRSL